MTRIDLSDLIFQEMVYYPAHVTESYEQSQKAQQAVSNAKER